MRITMEAPELARVLANALAFMPARSQVKYALLDVFPDRVYTSGTDGYAAGTDWAPTGETGDVPADGVPLLLDKEGLTALERVAREAKKGVLYFKVLDGTLTLYPGDEAPELQTPWYADEHTEGLHATIREMIEKREADAKPFDGPVCFDPGFMSRFAKVKADKARQADLFFTGPKSALLVKVGPTFKGLIMPIDREVHAKNVGEDGLW